MTSVVVVSPLIAARQRAREEQRRSVCAKLAGIVKSKYAQLDKQQYWQSKGCDTVTDPTTGQSICVYAIDRKQYEKPTFRRHWHHRFIPPAWVCLGREMYLAKDQDRMFIVKQRWLNPLTDDEIERFNTYSINEMDLELASDLCETLH